MAPVVALLALCLLMTVEGGAVIGYTETVARSLHEPAGYIEGVLGTEQQGERAK
jgi:multicomponent K+:H+ antiporter subunit D